MLKFGNRDRAELERADLSLALIHEVGERGYRDADPPQVCCRAGLSEDAFHRHFADLEDAYCQVSEDLIRQVFARVLDDFADRQTWREQIRAAAHAIYEFMDEDRRRGRFMVVEVFNAGERAQRMRGEALAVLAGLIDQGRQELADPESLTPATAEAIAGTVFRKVRIALEQDDPHTDRLLPMLMYSVVLPYVGSEQAQLELEVDPLKIGTNPC